VIASPAVPPIRKTATQNMLATQVSFDGATQFATARRKPVNSRKFVSRNNADASSSTDGPWVSSRKLRAGVPSSSSSRLTSAPSATAPTRLTALAMPASMPLNRNSLAPCRDEELRKHWACPLRSIK